MKTGDLSVCIVSWNVRDDLGRCLDSLGADPAAAPADVIVVDNASSDDSVAVVSAQYPHVRLIANQSNRGFAAASNQALQASESRYALLLNPDTIVPPSALSELIALGDRNPDAGIIGPRLLNPDGSLQYSCRRFPSVRAAIFRNTLIGRIWSSSASEREYLMADWDHSTPRDVDWVSGAAMLVRRELLGRIGLLDESFFWGSEDVDLCWRAHRAGWRVLYTPTPQITHIIGRSTDQAVLPTIIRCHRSMYSLYRKHVARDPVRRSLVWCGVWARAGLLASSWLLRRFVRR